VRRECAAAVGSCSCESINHLLRLLLAFSWLHDILFCLLRMDDCGSFPAPLEELLGSSGQIYPDSLPEVTEQSEPGGESGLERRGGAAHEQINYGFASTVSSEPPVHQLARPGLICLLASSCRHCDLWPLLLPPST
jgi:hypothetical protein